MLVVNQTKARGEKKCHIKGERGTVLVSIIQLETNTML